MVVKVNPKLLSDTIVHLTIMVEAIQINIDRTSAAVTEMRGQITALSDHLQAEPAPLPRRKRRNAAVPRAAIGLGA